MRKISIAFITAALLGSGALPDAGSEQFNRNMSPDVSVVVTRTPASMVSVIPAGI